MGGGNGCIGWRGWGLASNRQLPLFSRAPHRPPPGRSARIPVSSSAELRGRRPGSGEGRYRVSKAGRRRWPGHGQFVVLPIRLGPFSGRSPWLSLRAPAVSSPFRPVRRRLPGPRGPGRARLRSPRPASPPPMSYKPAGQGRCFNSVLRPEAPGFAAQILSESSRAPPNACTKAIVCDRACRDWCLPGPGRPSRTILTPVSARRCLFGYPAQRVKGALRVARPGAPFPWPSQSSAHRPAGFWRRRGKNRRAADARSLPAACQPRPCGVSPK